MLPIQYLSFNNQSAYRWSDLLVAIANCASKKQIDVTNNSGFSRQQKSYFITPPCNYKLS